MANHAGKAIDVAVYGATGFTGQLVAEYLAHNYPAASGVRWAMAGRNAEKLESVREANVDDVSAILALIEPFEKDGTMVKRDRNELERDIGNYTIIEHDGVIFGCAALYPYAEERSGEMAALTVSTQSQSQGDGERLLKRIEQRARAMGLREIFVLTTRTMHWFVKRGFVEAPMGALPEARRNQYNWDRRSKVLVKKL